MLFDHYCKRARRLCLRTTGPECRTGNSLPADKKRATSTHCTQVKVTLSSALLVTMSIVNRVISFVNIVIILKSALSFLCILYNSLLITQHRSKPLHLKLPDEQLAFA